MIEFGQIKDRHKGADIIVCGCGESAVLLKDLSKNVIIGVNDIGRIYQPNYLVVVNDKISFKPERWAFIENTQASIVFTHIRGLPVDESKRCIITLGKYGHSDLDKPAVDYTNNSPYIGVIIAYKMGARNIGLLGVDFTPNHFFAKTGDHPLSRKTNAINNEYIMLGESLAKKGVGFYNLSPNSKINVQKMYLDDFQNMQK